MRLIAIVVSSTVLVFALSNRTKPQQRQKSYPSNRAARVSMQRKHPTDHARRWLQ